MKRNLLIVVTLFFSLALNAQYWSQQNTNMAGTSTAVDQVSIVDSNIVWVNGTNGSGAGQFIQAHSRTKDGGATWTAGSYTGFTQYVQAKVLTAVDYNKAFCVALDTATSVPSFWQTIDGGTTWTIVTGILNGGATFSDGVKFWDNGKGFCYGDPVSNEYDIYTTSDSGATWNDVDGANIADPYSTAEYGYDGPECTATVAGGIGFFFTNLGRVYKTIDYGATWTVTPTSPFVQTGTYGSNKIYASSENFIICAVYTTVWEWKYTTDGGTTWNTYTPVTGTFYQWAMCYVPETPNMFVATSPDFNTAMGVGYSYDGGFNWVDYLDATYLQPTGGNIQCIGVGFYNESIGWVGNYTQPFTINSILKYHPAPVGMDAGALTILQPTISTVSGTDVQVIVKVKNFGTDTIHSMDIAYQVDVSTPVSVPWTGSLLPDSTLDYIFVTTYVAPASVQYNLCAYTVVTGDIYPSNDETCVSLSGTVGINEGYSNGLILNQNFPNPANGQTTIDFTVPNNGEAVLSLMNSIGKVVYKESKKVNSGSQQIILNISGFAAGVYFYEFDFNGSKLYKKMIIN